MQYDAQLRFAADLLKGLHISCSVIAGPADGIGPEVDKGLRSLLYGAEDYNTILQNSLSSARDNVIYRFFDEYDCKYIFMKLPDTAPDSYFFIGPYLLEAAAPEHISRIAARLDLPDGTAQLGLYYASLPIAEDENWLLTIASTLGNYLWPDQEFEMEYVEYMIPDRTDPISVISSADPVETSRNLATLEANYANEKLLMDAVSRGKLHLITAVASSVFTNGTEQRISDSLRNRKNYLIILNTLLRKAAEEGGVHPLHIDRRSSHFARRIENIHTIKQSLSLQEEMIRSYCLLVRQQSLSKYSFYVARAITRVQYDLTADLSLKTIAAELNVNPSYLSSLFHKEYGCTLTDFVNRQRIDRALTLLGKSKKAVQDIAAECGIQDVNYFIKLFKKHTGMTPNQYRRINLH